MAPSRSAPAATLTPVRESAGRNRAAHSRNDQSARRGCAEVLRRSSKIAAKMKIVDTRSGSSMSLYDHFVSAVRRDQRKRKPPRVPRRSGSVRFSARWRITTTTRSARRRLRSFANEPFNKLQRRHAPRSRRTMRLSFRSMRPAASTSRAWRRCFGGSRGASFSRN